nr:hypothetical protein Iba_chr14eCG5850 [Ipomoea batatas]
MLSVISICTNAHVVCAVKLPEVQIPEAEHSRLVSGRGCGRGGGGSERAGRWSKSRRGGLVAGRGGEGWSVVAEQLRARCRSLVAVTERLRAGRRRPRSWSESPSARRSLFDRKSRRYAPSRLCPWPYALTGLGL